VRLKLDDAPVRLAATNRLDEALAALVSSPPAFLVVDSIQHMVTTSGTRSLPGSPGMAVAALRRIVAFARLYNTVAIVICHVTKSSRAAGPNTLQHDVDVLMHLEAKAEWRALRSTKNRYGSTNTPGLFRMKEDGLHGITRSQP
jgi:DNA repair protein RadA/Sms